MRGTRHCRGASKSSFLALTTGLLVACARGRDLPPPDTLVVAVETGPLSLDPRIGVDQASWRVHQTVMNGLVKNGDRGEFLPDLAASFGTTDGVLWRFRLREGVRFHDGRPLTSADVAYTFRSLFAPGFPASTKRSALSIIERIETPSPLDVELHLKEAYASLPLQLLLGILPEGTTPEEAARRPVGTGPFRFVAYHPDDRVVFERWDGYFGGKALHRRLVFRIVPDATTRALELLRGSLHLAINNIPPDLLPRLSASPGLAVTVREGSTYAYVGFNLRDPALSNVKVRRALALAIDRQALAAGLWRGTVRPTETLLPPGHWARADLPPLVRDPARARQLLDEAGFPEPGGGAPRLRLTYKTSTDESTLLQATALAAQWREVGVEARIRSNDFSVFFEDVKKGAFQVISLRWQGIVDPDHYHDTFLSTNVPPKGWNRGFFKDSELDSWVLAARRIPDRTARRELYLKVQKRLWDELPYISLYTHDQVAVHDARLTGLASIPQTGDFTFLPLVGRR